MNSTIDLNANNAVQTAEKAAKSETFVRQSANQIESTIQMINQVTEFFKTVAEKIEKLGSTTETINEILQVIYDIADQTNLLALNAAIEAARAGEYGRGFAVVADEVRKLADRSSKSTEEIEKIIKEISNETKNAVKKIKEGNELFENIIEQSKNSINSLQGIMNNTEEIVGLINQIASAGEEQSASARIVSNNIGNISNMIQESNEAINQIAIATNDLTKLSVNLQSLLSLFKLSEKDNSYQYMEKLKFNNINYVDNNRQNNYKK